MRKSIVLCATAALLALSMSANAAVVVIGASPSFDIDKMSMKYDLVKPDVYNIELDDVAVLLNPGISIPDGDGKHQLPAGAIAKSVTTVNRYEVPPHIGWLNS
jgi:hypothetical protein